MNKVLRVMISIIAVVLVALSGATSTAADIRHILCLDDCCYDNAFGFRALTEDSEVISEFRVYLEDHVFGIEGLEALDILFEDGHVHIDVTVIQIDHRTIRFEYRGSNVAANTRSGCSFGQHAGPFINVNTTYVPRHSGGGWAARPHGVPCVMFATRTGQCRACGMLIQETFVSGFFCIEC